MSNDTQEKSPSEQAFDLNASWNPPPTDDGLHRMVGDQREEHDTRATVAVQPENPGVSPTSSKVDAQRMDLYKDDGDDNSGGSTDAEELKGQALDDALEARGLSKSGTADEKRQRVADHDAGNGDDDE